MYKRYNIPSAVQVFKTKIRTKKKGKNKMNRYITEVNTQLVECSINSQMRNKSKMVRVKNMSLNFRPFK